MNEIARAGDERFMRRMVCVGVGLALCSCGDFNGGGSTKEERDVSGNYAITYQDDLTLKLNVGGAVREVTHSGYGGVVDFGVVNGQPVTLDLGAFCGREDVQCPSEAFWPKVAVTQPNLGSSALELQQLTVVNDTVHTLDAGVRAASLSGLVDHAQHDRFLLGLGVEAGAAQGCAAIAISLAGGRFSRVGERVESAMEWRTSKGAACSPDAGVPDGGVDCALVNVQRLVIPPNAAVNGIVDGKVGLGWLGGCAFGPVLVGATLTMETSFTGVRTGSYDPPPFTPAPVVLPADGGFDEPDAGP